MRELFLKPLHLRDEHIVESLLDQLAAYSMLVDGIPKVEGAARRFLTAVPHGCTPSSKHVFAVVQKAKSVGLVDVIDGYPRTSVAFIGLLAIREDRQNEGLGRRSYELVERFAREQLEATTFRLAVVETNPATDFWKKMGFTETGEVKRYRGEARTSNAILMEKRIDT